MDASTFKVSSDICNDGRTDEEQRGNAFALDGESVVQNIFNYTLELANKC